MVTQNELLDRMIKDNRWWLPGWRFYPNPPLLSRDSTLEEAEEFKEAFGGCVWLETKSTKDDHIYEWLWVVRIEDNLESFLLLLYEELKIRDPHNRINYVIWTMEALECFNAGGEYGSTKSKSTQRR